MNQYWPICKKLGLSDAVISCGSGAVPPPIVTLVAPAEWFGFPPALVPVWSDGSSGAYYGWWRHWFGSRKPSFVIFGVEEKKAYEIARNEDQFLYLALLRSIVSSDRVLPKHLSFAEKVGIRDVGAVDAVSLVTGDDPRGLASVGVFAADLPRESADASQYAGDFPGVGAGGEGYILQNACSFELPDDIEDQLRPGEALPRWIGSGLSEDDLPKMFRRFVKAKDFRSAWLCLNSTGWALDEARGAISELALVSGDALFGEWAQAWLSVAHGPFVTGY